MVARLYLATQVAGMMGRKLEEGDWSKVYCAAKGIPHVGWSNLSIDVTYGYLGIEHKMICRKSDRSIREFCGTTIMHPAGTRSIRIPKESDATVAARNVLTQYVELIEARENFISILARFNNSTISRDDAVLELIALFKYQSSAPAKRLLPAEPEPTLSDYSLKQPELRTGWLLWQESLREFLYFEEKTFKPNPHEYYAEWVESGGGRRKKSQNLWVYHTETKEKHYSITTDAGAKIQPYFMVPPPDDPNLYYFIVQGEPIQSDLIRLWLTDITASFLKHLLGSLDIETVSKAIVLAADSQVSTEKPDVVFGVTATEVLITEQAYMVLQQSFLGVSDEHRMQQLLVALRENPNLIQTQV